MWNRKSCLVSALLFGVAGVVLLGVGCALIPPLIVPGLFLFLVGGMIFIGASAEQTPNYAR
jgi:hypothetical protein